MNIRPLKNNIIFKFLEDTVGKKGAFLERQRESGIIIPLTANTQRVHRWGVALAVGPEVDGVQPGDYILIEALMWMEGVKLSENEKVWKTDDSKVLAVTNDISVCQSQAL